MVKKTFQYIIAVYLWTVGILSFCLFMLFSLLFSLFIPFRKMDKQLRFIIRMILKMMFIRVEKEGFSALDKQAVYVFMPNHVSYFDSFVLYAHLPFFLRGIEIQNHFSWFLYGYFIRKFGNIPIDQTSLQKSKKSMFQAVDYLSDGISVLVFPEGQRTLTGKVEKFKRLPFLLAKEAKSAIVPIGLCGFQRLLPAGSWLIRPTKVSIKIGKIIDPETIEQKNSKDLCEYTWKEVIRMTQTEKQ